MERADGIVLIQSPLLLLLLGVLSWRIFLLVSEQHNFALSWPNTVCSRARARVVLVFLCTDCGLFVRQYDSSPNKVCSLARVRVAAHRGHSPCKGRLKQLGKIQFVQRKTEKGTRKKRLQSGAKESNSWCKGRQQLVQRKATVRGNPAVRAGRQSERDSALGDRKEFVDALAARACSVHALHVLRHSLHSKL